MMEEKKFGTSVFDFIPEEDKETIENDFFKEEEYNENEIENMRKEISLGKNAPIRTTVTKDALSGITADTMVTDDDKDFDEIDENIKKNDIQGKTITNYGKNLIKSIMNRDATDEECKYISSKFEEHYGQLKKCIVDKDNKDIGTFNDDITIEALETLLPEEILGQVKSVSGDSYDKVIRRFLYQIFFTYSNTLSFRDDISELNSIGRKIKRLNALDEENSIDANMNEEEYSDQINKQYESMQQATENINKYLSIVKGLDDRNKRMRQDYTIDDIDIYTIEDVKKCLDMAVNFTKVRITISNAAGKFKKDIKHVEDMNSSIDSWITDIKNDSKVLYTFPCNDFLTASESREEIIKFFYNAYLVDIAQKNNMTVPVDRELDEYLIENNLLTNEDSIKLKTKARIMLYMLSRTFKYKKVESDKVNIRILSYTLDIISKLAIKDHLDSFIDISNYVYEQLV